MTSNYSFILGLAVGGGFFLMAVWEYRKIKQMEKKELEIKQKDIQDEIDKKSFSGLVDQSNERLGKK